MKFAIWKRGNFIIYLNGWSSDLHCPVHSSVKLPVSRDSETPRQGMQFYVNKRAGFPCYVISL